MKVSGQLHASATLLAGKEPLDRRLGGPQSRSGHSSGEEKNPCPCRELSTGPVPSLVTILTELPRVLKLFMIYIYILTYLCGIEITVKAYVSVAGTCEFLRIWGVY
jgi:hypothetical protein